jgi:hypothetical protein
METNKDPEIGITGNYKTLLVKTTKTFKIKLLSREITPSVGFIYFMKCTFSFLSYSTNGFTASYSEQCFNSNT